MSKPPAAPPWECTCVDGDPVTGECWACGVRDCPHGHELHYDKDGCPPCSSAPTIAEVAEGLVVVVPMEVQTPYPSDDYRPGGRYSDEPGNRAIATPRTWEDDDDGIPF